LAVKLAQDRQDRKNSRLRVRLRLCYTILRLTGPPEILGLHAIQQPPLAQLCLKLRESDPSLVDVV
jgi:hypothetical protein